MRSDGRASCIDSLRVFLFLPPGCFLIHLRTLGFIRFSVFLRTHQSTWRPSWVTKATTMARRASGAKATNAWAVVMGKRRESCL